MANDRHTFITYYDNDNDDLKYDSGDAHSTVDSDGHTGKSTSLALDDDGYAHISYHDDTHNATRLRYANNVPEPGMLAVAGVGLVVLAALVRRRNHSE